MKCVCKDRECTRCGHIYEINIFGDPESEDRIEMLTALQYDDEPQPGLRGLCPECAWPEYRQLASVATGVRLGDVGGVGKFYPYYDRGLGRQINNDAEREAACRELGVQPLDGAEIDEERYGNAYVENLTRSIKRWKDLEAEYKSQEDTAKALVELQDKHKDRVKEALDGTSSTDSSHGYSTTDVRDADGEPIEA